MKKAKIIWAITLIVLIFNMVLGPMCCVVFATDDEISENQTVNSEESSKGTEKNQKGIEEEEKNSDNNEQLENKKEDIEEQIKDDKEDTKEEQPKDESGTQKEEITKEENETQKEGQTKDEETQKEGQVKDEDENQKEEQPKDENEKEGQIKDEKENTKEEDTKSEDLKDEQSENSMTNDEQQEENVELKEEQTEEIKENMQQVQSNINAQIIDMRIQEKAEQTVLNGTYVISSAMNSNLALDVSGNTWASGANVTVWKKNNGNNQKFKIKYMSEGYYTIEVVSSGKYLSGTSLNGKVEDNVIQSTYTGKENQKWIIKDAGNGYYYIISKASSLYLDIYGGAPVNGANCQLYTANNNLNQKFKFEKVNMITGSYTVNEGTYTISTKMDFNKILDVYNASTSNNANVELYTRNNSSNQKYKLIYDGNGYYKIVALHSNKVLTVKNAETGEGANVIQYEDLGLDAQKWVIKSAGNGYYYIISKCNGLYLDLYGGVADSGTNVEVYGGNNRDWQKFKFFSTEIKSGKTLSEGNYVISTALTTSRVLDVEGDVAGNNANIDLWKNNGGNNQKFIITYLNDGYYTIKAFNSNKVLTVKNSSKQSGTNVIQSYYNGQDAQKWSIQNDTNGYYTIVSKVNGLSLDIEGGVAKDGANVEVYEPNGGKNQKFRFAKTEFTSTIPNGKYAILASSNTKKVIDIPDASTNNGVGAELWDSNGGSNQSFYFEYVGEGCYTIQAANSKKMLTAKKSRVVQQEYTNSDSQKWVITKSDSSGNYSIRLKGTDTYLDIYNNNMVNGTIIEVYGANDSNAQKFRLEELLYKGIDVSKYQNDINWRYVSREIDFTMIRVGYRGYGEEGKIVEDPYFKKNIKSAFSNDIECGVYFYTQAKNEQEAIEEARWVINEIRESDIKYPVAVDTEWSPYKTGRADWISKEERTRAIKAFCQTIKNAGYVPMIYASRDWLNEQLDMKQLSNYDVWVAHYVEGAPNNKTDYNGSYTMWQYTSSGRVNGVVGNVDMNLCYKKYN